jgi:TRAP-type mannitol/chloroaromatic compound transport system permease large subunit
VIRQALASTTRLSAFVMFILIGARVFSLTFYGVNGHIWVEHLLTSLPGGEIWLPDRVSVLVFLLAFFLDFFELAFIIVPLLVAPAEALGIDLIWFGVILAVNMQTSFMHPPFGFALFYLRSVAPKAPLSVDKVTGERLAGGIDRADLLGGGALRGHPGGDDRGRDRLPARWSCTTRAGGGPLDRRDQGADPHPAGPGRRG